MCGGAFGRGLTKTINIKHVYGFLIEYYKFGVGILTAFLKHRWSFHDVQLSRSIDCAYQAIAIDEQRKPFAAAIWQQQPGSVDQLLEQSGSRESIRR